ncbi:hypothetical protein F528_2366 [Neisseria meningitidis 992008]|nr:hypothetical protein F528_2366 [Neisseria meningitidis 992008]
MLKLSNSSLKRIRACLSRSEKRKGFRRYLFYKRLFETILKQD